MTFDTPMKLEDAMTDFPGLSRAPAAFLVRLHESKGRIVLFEDLSAATEAVTGNRSSMYNLSSIAKRARRAIIGAGEIISAPGVGYRLVWS